MLLYESTEQNILDSVEFSEEFGDLKSTPNLMTKILT